MKIDKKSYMLGQANGSGGGGGEPAAYLKSIEKDETNKKITITDKQGTETEFPYGSTEPAMQYRENQPFTGTALGIDGKIFNLAYANGIYLLTVRGAGFEDKLYKSTDKVNWTEITISSESGLFIDSRGLKGLNNKFVVVDCNLIGNSRVCYSDDGENWNESVLVAPSGSIVLNVEPRTIVYENGKYMFVGLDDENFCAVICTSQNLENWEVRYVQNEEVLFYEELYIDRSTNGDGMYIGLSYDVDGEVAIFHSYNNGLYFRGFNYTSITGDNEITDIVYANHKLYVFGIKSLGIIPYDASTETFDLDNITYNEFEDEWYIDYETPLFQKDGKIFTAYLDGIGVHIATVNDDGTLNVIFTDVYGGIALNNSNFIEVDGTLMVVLGDNKLYQAKFGGIFQDGVNITDKIKELLA